MSQLFFVCRQPTFTCLRDEIVEDRHSVFDPAAAEAVDGPFCVVVEQFQPKQRNAIKIGLWPSTRSPLLRPARPKLLDYPPEWTRGERTLARSSIQLASFRTCYS
jgi:hypothetical protein